MNSERFKKIEEVYQAVLEISPDMRDSFLQKICGGDGELRKEVESLLEFENSSENFMNTPPESLAAEMIQEAEKPETLEEKNLKHYKIESLLGMGGMGAVYLAQDEKLLRSVALKILPADVIEDENRVQRFIHEARAASALNHPNILTIYDIDETEGRHFIAMEYVDGETLHEKIYRPQTDLKKIINYLAQTADGLAKAHAAGIIHRDLKPENIMVSKDGFAKILDFGLAKLVGSETVLKKFQRHESVKGAIMGTLGYMSPEQAQGRSEIDRRADIFSFGCILYEAAAKQKPFRADSTVDTLYRIIHDKPPEIAGVSAELRDIINRCLEKNADERFQTIEEIAVRLRDLEIEPPAASSSEDKTMMFPAPVSTGTISQSFYEQRHQATILFADFSVLNEMLEDFDPEEANEIANDLWTRLEKIIETNGGQTEKSVGGSFIAFWGAQVMSEEDPERAVRTALDLQKETLEFFKNSVSLEENFQTPNLKPQPLLKIGISTGTTLFNKSTDTGEFTTSGAAVNTAKRLHQNAPIGTILLAHDTYWHVRGVFDVGEFQIERKFALTKGKQTKVYEVFRAKPRAFRVNRRGVEGIQTELVGRSEKLKKMLDALEIVQEDGEMQIVNVCGDAGLGKSRLLDEFINRIELLPEKLRVFKGKANEAMSGLPFSLVKDVFSFRFEIRESDLPETAREKFVKGVLNLTENSPADFGVGEEALMKAHFIGQLIGFDFSGSPFIKGILDDEKQIGDRAHLYAAQFFQAVTSEHAAILFLDDLHWADDASLDFFQSVAENCRQSPFLILEFTRPLLFERRPHWGEGKSNRLRLDLEPLTKGESRRLVNDILQKMPDGAPQKLRDLLVKNAEGNPFYLEELVKMMIEQGVVITDSEKWRFDESRLGKMSLPPTLTGVLQARLNKLSLWERKILQQASVVGREFWDSVIESFGAAEVNVKSVLESLRRKEFLFRHETSAFDGANEYIFKHALLRDAVYETVLLQERRELHRKTAEWLIEIRGERRNENAAAIAVHFEKAQIKDKAAEWFGRAGERARKANAPETAVKYFKKALAYADAAETKTADLLELRRRLGRALMSLARYEESCAVLSEMEAEARAAGDNLAKARALHELSSAKFENGENQAALENAEKSVAAAQDAGDSVEARRTLVYAMYRQGRALIAFGKLDEVIELSKKALTITDELGDAAFAERAFCFHLLAAAYMMLGKLEPALRYEEKELELTRRIGDKRTISNGVNSLGEIFRLQGDGEKAISYYREAAALAREIGNRATEIMALSNIGAAKLLLEDFSGAESDLREVIRMTENKGHFILTETYRFLAEALLKQNKISEAVEAAQISFASAVEAENLEDIAGAWRVFGLISAHTRKPVEINGTARTAAECFNESLKIFAEVKMEAARARVLRDFAAFEKTEGRANAAREMSAEARKIFTKLEMPLEAERCAI